MEAVAVVIYILVAVVGAATTVQKVRALRTDPQDQPLRATCIIAAALTASIVVQPLAWQLDRLVGVVNFARVLSHCFVLIAATGGQAFLIYVSEPTLRAHKRVRAKCYLLGAGIVALLVTHVLHPPRYGIHDPAVVSKAYYWSSENAPGPAYALVFLSFIGWSAFEVALLAFRYSRIAPDVLLRAGLRLVSLGGMLIMPYIALKIGSVLLPVLSLGMPLVFFYLIMAPVVLATAAFLVGITLPSWGGRVGLDRLLTAVEAWLDCRRLEPLWALVCGAAPQLQLLPDTGSRLRYLNRSPVHRVRMTLEILDGYAVLQPWMDRRVATAARAAAEQRGLGGEDLDAAVEAAVLRAAAQACRQRSQPRDDERLVKPPHGVQQTEVEAGTEIHWLRQVARALKSPLTQLSET